MSGARRRTSGIVLYCAIAFAVCWAACLPLWLGPGLSDPGLVALCGGIAMVTPALTAIAVVRVVERRPWRVRAMTDPADRGGAAGTPATVWRSLGLRLGGGAKRVVAALMVGLLSPVVLLFASLVLAAAVGTYDLDPTLRQVVADLGMPTDASGADAWAAFSARLATAMLLGATITTILALGEEIGWRGYLLPRMHERWGLPVAIVGGGIIWGLWHAPLILLGYNYPDAAPWVGQLAMIAACTVVGGFLYLLTVGLRSVWPAALAHGVNNGVSGFLVASLLVPGSQVDTVNGSPLGWPGWIVYGVVVIVGFSLLRLRRSRFTPGFMPADKG
ncbi:lysostaphin resistance A-like protein [Microbacterium sp. NPDC089695]|uniref:CPBP family intramembrane glutamic endopeptidase n=1 Tax=Microbacterium sp. NPDC089695 TaxID=3364198 RepID=UPI00382D909F